MNSAATILTSVVVSAVVASVFNIFGQAIERRSRNRELIFMKAVELALANREFIAMVADKTNCNATISDPVVYAEMYYSLLKELHDKGRLPSGRRESTAKIMEDHLRSQ